MSSCPQGSSSPHILGPVAAPALADRLDFPYPRAGIFPRRNFGLNISLVLRKAAQPRESLPRESLPQDRLALVQRYMIDAEEAEARAQAAAKDPEARAQPNAEEQLRREAKREQEEADARARAAAMAAQARAQPAADEQVRRKAQGAPPAAEVPQHEPEESLAPQGPPPHAIADEQPTPVVQRPIPTAKQEARRRKALGKAERQAAKQAARLGEAFEKREARERKALARAAAKRRRREQKSLAKIVR